MALDAETKKRILQALWTYNEYLNQTSSLPTRKILCATFSIPKRPETRSQPSLFSPTLPPTLTLSNPRCARKTDGTLTSFTNRIGRKLPMLSVSLPRVPQTRSPPKKPRLLLRNPNLTLRVFIYAHDFRQQHPPRHNHVLYLTRTTPLGPPLSTTTFNHGLRHLQQTFYSQIRTESPPAAAPAATSAACFG